MSIKHCVNCPGRTDHDTADCPVMHYGTLDPQQRLDVARGTYGKVLIDRELLEEALTDLESGMMCNPSAETLHQLRTLLSEPQASAAQSAHMVLVDLQHCVFRGKNADGSDPIAFQITQESPLRFGEIASIKMHGWRCIGPLQDGAAQSAPAGEREAFNTEYDAICNRPITGREIAWRMHQAGAAWQRAQSAPVVQGTPGASWRANGEPDPHGDRYNCERAALAMGNLSDDELANGAFLNYDAPLNLEGILAGTHSAPIAWMTAVKDRIRWLSRKLDEALAAAPAQPAAQGEFGDAYQGAREDLAIWKRRALEAEEKVRHQERIIDHMTLEAQGESRMGEPAIPAAQDQGEVQRLREALEQVLALFPAAISRQSFVINSGPALRADDDDEFYSAKKVGRLLDQVVGIIRDALAASTGQEVKP